MTIAFKNRGGIQPNDYTFATSTTPHRGTFGKMTTTSKETTPVTTSSDNVFCWYLEDHDWPTDTATNPSMSRAARLIELVTGEFEVETDQFNGVIGGFTVGSPVYVDVASGTMKLSAAATGNIKVGLCTGKTASVVFAYLHLPTF